MNYVMEFPFGPNHMVWNGAVFGFLVIPGALFQLSQILNFVRVVL